MRSHALSLSWFKCLQMWQALLLCAHHMALQSRMILWTFQAASMFHAAAYQLSLLPQQPTCGLQLVQYLLAGAQRTARRAGFSYCLGTKTCQDSLFEAQM